MEGNHFGLLLPHKPHCPPPPTLFFSFLYNMFKASEHPGTEISHPAQIALVVSSLQPNFWLPAFYQGFPPSFLSLLLTALELALFPFLEPTVWSQRGLSASLGSANKLGSGGHTAGDLEAWEPLTPFLLVSTIHTISGAGMPSQWGPTHCLVTKIL